MSMHSVAIIDIFHENFLLYQSNLLMNKNKQARTFQYLGMIKSTRPKQIVLMVTYDLSAFSTFFASHRGDRTGSFSKITMNLFSS